jgi:hypothetical protein
MPGSLIKSTEYWVPFLSFFNSRQPFRLISNEHAIEFDSETDN